MKVKLMTELREQGCEGARVRGEEGRRTVLGWDVCQRETKKERVKGREGKGGNIYKKNNREREGRKGGRKYTLWYCYCYYCYHCYYYYYH